MNILYSKHPVKLGRNTDILVEIPNICPHCGQTMVPKISCNSNLTITTNEEPVVSLLCQCLYCNEFFALTYKILDEQIGSYETSTFKTELIPYTYSIFVEYDIPEEIEKFSQTFKEIYQQSQKAEAYNLNQIAGIGYRKSIEFLVKDFLIYVKKNEKIEVSNLPLSQAINKLKNPSMISLAKAATWIGNDETHYTRKYEDKDISDMKKYIRALSNYLSSEYLVSESSLFINEN